MTSPVTRTIFTRPARSPLRLPFVAAFLSFLVPGLGQAALGAYRRALLFFLPTLVLVLVALYLGPRGFERGLFDPAFLTGLWWVNLVAFVYHLVAVIDAYLLANRAEGLAARETADAATADPAAPATPDPAAPDAAPTPADPSPYSRPGLIASLRSRRRATTLVNLALLAALFAATTVVHGYVAVVDAEDQAALSAIFNPVTPWGGTTGSAGSVTQAPRWTGTGTLSVLLIGIDRGPGGDRSYGLRPDSMILLRIDPVTGRAAMFGIPRNFVNVPLPPEVASHYACRCWGPAPGSGEDPNNYLLDYLWQEAAYTHPDWYAVYGTDPWVRGIRAVEGAVGELTGVKLDGAFLIDLQGFTKLVNSIGGIEIYVPTELKDTQYPILEHPGTMTIDIKPGWQHMDGVTALEYARSRHSTSDYDRMRRQQAVLRAIRDSVGHPCAMVPRLPGILGAIKGTFWTDLPIQSAPDLMALAEHVGNANTASYTLVPAAYDVGSTDVYIPEYLDAASIAKVRSVVAHGFDKVPSATHSATPGSSPNGSGANGESGAPGATPNGGGFSC